MSTADLDPIPRACRLLREGAAELRNCHTLAATGHDWTGEPEAKAAYDEYVATADALERVHAECETLRTGYNSARLEIESLQARIKTMAEERADELTVAHLDGRMRAAHPAGAQQPVEAYVALPNEREAFETWFTREYHSRLCRNMPGKSYNDPTAHSMWAAWQARASHGQAPATLQSGEQPLPLLVKDIAADLATTPIQVCMALSALGFGGHSVNMAVTPTMAQALRAHFSATEQAAPAYKDSTPELHVGDSAFESWYSTYNPAHKSDKQRARDAYAAGMGDPLVMAAPAAVAVPSDEAAIERTRDLASNGRWPSDWIEAYRRGHADAAPTTQPAPQREARPVTPYTCPKCHALWLHWPAEQSGFAMDTLNCRSTTHCDYCEKGGVEQLQRLERVPASQGDALSQAARDVLAERQRQISVEGWTPEHDDEHINDEIAAMACYYVMPPGAREWDSPHGYGATLGEAILPEGWNVKDCDRRRELVKGTALALAELERMDRVDDARAAQKGGA